MPAINSGVHETPTKCNLFLSIFQAFNLNFICMQICGTQFHQITPRCVGGLINDCEGMPFLRSLVSSFILNTFEAKTAGTCALGVATRLIGGKKKLRHKRKYCQSREIRR